MRQKMKKMNKIIILGIVFMLFSCSEDLYDDHISKSKINSKNVSLNDDLLKQNSKLMKSVNQIKSLNNKSYSKIIYDSINNFYIDDENGIFLDYNGAISYSFRVLRENTAGNSKVENIVFNQTETGDYDSYLLKYAFSKNEFDALPFEGTNAINYEIEQVDVLVSSRVTAPKCKTIRVSKCSGVPWDCGGGICGYDYVIQCDEGSGGNGGTSWDGGGSSGGINTVPTGGGSNAVANPCKKFKKQQDSYPNLKQDLINLEATKTQNHENGIFVDSNSPNVQNATSSTTASSTVVFPNLTAPNKYKIMAHTHDAYGPNGTGTFSIFSWGDILQAADIIKENEYDDDFFTYYLATADGTRYAFTIDWPSAFYEVFDINTNPNNPSQTNYFNSQKFQELYEIEKKYYSETPIPGKISYTSNPEDDLKVFLKMMKELKLNASLFEVDQTYTTFTKLSLNSDGTVKRGTPCN
jgi:hypothetical protein